MTNTTGRIIQLACALITVNCTSALAQQPPKVARAAPQPAWSWSGTYIGGHLGGGHGTTRVDNPYGASIYGSDIRTPTALAGLQIGHNWQRPGSRWVFGIEADLSILDSDGTNTCLAYSGYYISPNCRVRSDAIGSMTARLGHVFGAGDRSLMYVKGGAALLASRFAMAANGEEQAGQSEQSSHSLQPGWTVGVGIEHAVTPAWSLKFEYDYARFASRDVGTTASLYQTIHLDAASATPTPQDVTRYRPDSHLLKLGLNYRLGEDAAATWRDRAGPVSDVSGAVPLSGWTAEFGARYWYSHGRYQNDLGSGTNLAHQTALISRLTYESTGHSGEIFGRIDAPHRMFLKGFAGGGALPSGKLNDEDWGMTDGSSPMAYSNTHHSKLNGHIAYATLDLGYDVFRTRDVTLGAFVGYNFYRDRKDVYGCTQIAYPAPNPLCGTPRPLTELGLSQNEDWHSLRVGLNGSVALVHGFRLAADAAYVPYASIAALDVHHQRTEMPSPSSPARGTGRGVQLEAILTYDVTDRFSVGVGGRYWAMWSTDTLTSSFGSPVPVETLPIRVERYGTFLQASYKFGAVR